MNNQKLNCAIQKMKQKLQNNMVETDIIEDRKNRKEYYKSFSKDKIIGMSKEEFFKYISQLWSMIMWGNKNHIVEKICNDNGFENIKNLLAELLYGDDEISKRWDEFKTAAKGIGPSTMSELLSYVNSGQYAIFNKTTIMAFEYLEIADLPKYNYQYTGKKYIDICNISKKSVKN